MNLMSDTRAEDVRALRAEVERLTMRLATQRGLRALAEAEANPPRPLPALEMYGGDIDDVVAAIRRRGVHPTEVAWVADYIEALADFKTRVGD